MFRIGDEIYGEYQTKGICDRHGWRTAFSIRDWVKSRICGWICCKCVEKMLRPPMDKKDRHLRRSIADVVTRTKRLCKQVMEGIII